MGPVRYELHTEKNSHLYPFMVQRLFVLYGFYGVGGVWVRVRVCIIQGMPFSQLKNTLNFSDTSFLVEHLKEAL